MEAAALGTLIVSLSKWGEISNILCVGAKEMTDMMMMLCVIMGWVPVTPVTMVSG